MSISEVHAQSDRVTQGEPVGAWKLGAFSVTEVRHRSGAVLDLHEHPVASLVMIVDGEYEEEAEGQRFILETNAIAYKPPHIAHVDRFVRGDVLSLCVEMPPDLLPERLMVQHVSEAGYIARRIRAEVHERAPGWQLIAEGLLLEAVGRLRRHEDRAAGAWLDDLEAMLRAGHIRSLGAAARLLHRDPSHLSRAFRTRFGCSVGEYVRDLRMNAICTELTTTAKPLVAIALEAGFCDQSHFTRVFSRRLAMTPGEYRRRYRR